MNVVRVIKGNLRMAFEKDKEFIATIKAIFYCKGNGKMINSFVKFDKFILFFSFIFYFNLVHSTFCYILK